MSIRVNTRSMELQRQGLSPNATSHEIQEKIQDLGKEAQLLSLVKERLIDQTKKDGPKIGDLTYENGRMQFPINSVRRFIWRAGFQLKAFFRGSSLTQERQVNTAILNYLEPKYDAGVDEIAKCAMKLAQINVRILVLNDLSL